jgi:bifunctional non-homologous end joining protein LigD
MLPEDAPEPFDSQAHLFEVLWDGIRTIAIVELGRTRLQDRWGRDITNRFPEIGGIASQVSGSGVALDGVIVCLNDEGRPDFRRLVNRLGIENATVAQKVVETAPVTFQACDLLYREGQTLGGWPLRRRKDMLRNLVHVGGALAVPDWVAQEGIAFFKAVRQHGLRGIIAKEIDSTYGYGERRRSWLTIPVFHRASSLLAATRTVVAGSHASGQHDRPRPRSRFSLVCSGMTGIWLFRPRCRWV